MEPSAPRVAILDVTREERKERVELLARLTDDGFQVDDLSQWTSTKVRTELDAVGALLVLCAPGTQAALDETELLRELLAYFVQHPDEAEAKYLPVLLGDDSPRFVPKFLSAQRPYRFPGDYDVLLAAIRGLRTPPVESKSKRKRPGPDAPPGGTKAASPSKRPGPSKRPAPTARPIAKKRPGATERTIPKEPSADPSTPEPWTELVADSDGDRRQLDHASIVPIALDALRLARALSGSRPIDAATLLTGIVVTARRRGAKRSRSFARIIELLPIEAPADAPEPTDRSSPSFELVAPLARALDWVFEHPTPDGKLHGRDLITATLLTRGDPTLEPITARTGTNVPELQDRWFAFVTELESYRPRADWQQWWRDAGVPLPSERGVRAGYLAESIGGEDRLGIEADVEAFARLIADAQTNPPLSIGLIGDWGSGKSFFMERVRDRVEALEGTGPGLCQQVVQIRFSAWHYSDANIWASLVGHIFDEVWTQMCPRPDDEQARAEVREQLKQAEGALFEAESEVERAREVLERVQQEERSALETLAVHRFVETKTTRALQSLADEVGWSASLASIVDLEQARDTLRTEASRTRRVVETALRGPALRRGLLWIAVVTVAAAGLALAAGWLWPQEWVQRTVRVIATVGAAIGSLAAAVTAPLTKARRMIGSLRTAVSGAIEEYEAKVEAARGSEAGKALVAKTDAARTELSRLRARAEAARERLAELERRRVGLDPARRLTAFIESRASTDDYRSQQGIISLVRRDFEQLSRLVQQWRAVGGHPPEGVRPVDRIVLYIDDLDRCSPPLVVRTLEAIHLLLALDLFVVVVAVDSRWLLRALAVHYEALLGARADDDGYRISTPQSYLEKIFQITFAVAPMTEDGFGRYVDALTGTRERPQEARETSDEPVVAAAFPMPASDMGASVQPIQQAQTPPPSQTLRAQQPAASTTNEPPPATTTTPSPAPLEPKPRAGTTKTPTPQDVTRALSVADAERRFLKQLHGMVATPRLVKRLVNVFRLVKSRVPPASLSEFEAEGTGRHRPVLLLLAILYGRPEHSPELFRMLCEGRLRGEDGDDSLHAGLRRLAEDEALSSQLRPVVGELIDWVRDVAPELTVAACEVEAYSLARYSLTTGQHWHTWRRASPRATAEIDAAS